MTGEEDDMEQKASNGKKGKKKNQNKFTEVCIHDSLIPFSPFFPLLKKVMAMIAYNSYSFLLLAYYVIVLNHLAPVKLKS